MNDLVIGAALALAAVAYVLQPLRKKASDLENVESPEGELDRGEGGEEAHDR